MGEVGLLVGGGACESPPPRGRREALATLWQLIWEELANSEEPRGPLWEITPSPFYRKDTWDPENGTSGQSHLLPQSPIKIFPILGLEGFPFPEPG